MDFDLRGTRALVIDDQEANLLLLEGALRHLGLEIELLADSRKAADAFVEFAPDIVLVDLHMPHLDGFEVLSLIQALSAKGTFLPVVMLTADITTDAKRRALELGATDFLTKPVDVTEVALRVANLLHARIMHKELQRRSESLESAVKVRTRELAEANDRLAALMRSKDEFVASVSHELRTPLSVVIGLAAELRDRPGSFSPETADELVRLIADQSTEVAFIVEDLLVAARSEIDTVSVLVQRVDVGAEVSRVLDPLPEPDRHRISISIPSGLVAAADAVRFRQVVRNLVNNALRYGGRNIEVTAVNRDARVVIGVADDGPGLPKAEWDRIFDAYQTAHRVTGRPASLGLGLTVSRRLARLMGGEIQYRVKAQNSLFECHLPVWSGGSISAFQLEASLPV